MKLLIVEIRRGQHKGKFGWVLRTDELLIQCLKKFRTREEAEADAAVFQHGPLH